MPDKSGRFTPKERTLVDVFVATGNKLQAGKAARYSEPLVAANHVLARPAIAAEVARLQLERIANELLPLAVDVHKELLTNKATPAGAKVQAVKLAYDRAFGSQDAAGGKQPHEMTGAELAAEIDKLKRRAADLATPVVDLEATADGVFS